MAESVTTQLTWRRTGKITLRSEPYLIIKYPANGDGPRYTALYGPQTARVTLGQGLASADAAKAVCEAHRQEKAASE